MPGPLPTPDAQRRRRNRSPGTVVLPAAGRPGEPPAWPWGAPSTEEARVWAALWTTPQAVAWEPLGAGVHRVLARMVRLMLACESPGVPAAALAELRLLEDRFGLSPVGMARLRWTVEDMGPGLAALAAHPSARLRAVDGAGERPPRRVLALDPAGDTPA